MPRPGKALTRSVNGRVAPPRHILVVEDGDADVYLIELAFVHCAVPHTRNYLLDGVQAVNYIRGARPYENRATYPRPDLVILDVHLPRKSGFEVLEWLRGEKNFVLPVIALSGSDNPEDRARALRLGAEQFYRKPFDYMETLGVIQEICERWLTPCRSTDWITAQ